MTDERPAAQRPVSVIGLGAMGTALAAALLRAGHPTTVWNRTPGRAAALTAQGARRAATAAAAVAASELAIVCLKDDRAARDVLAAVPDATLAGRVVVNLTTGAPAGARDWEARLRERGAAYLDGGILAVPEAIGSADAFVLYGGDATSFDELEPTLAALGRAVWLGPDPGLAAAHDLALQSGMYGLYAGALHAVALVASAGGDVAAFKRDLLVPWLDGMVAFATDAAAADGSVPAAFDPAGQTVALGSLLDASRAQGVDDALAGHLRTALDVMRRAAAAAGA